MNIPVIGLIENMSFVKCPDCGREIKVFGESKLEDVAKDFNIEVLGKIPIDSRLATACDRGMIELFDGSWLDYASEKIRMLVAGGDNA